MKPDDLKKKAEKLGVTPEVYLFMQRSDRKMRYFTYDLKTEKIIIDGARVTIIPAQEDSLDHLGDQGQSFAAEEESVEDRVIAAILREQLHDALELLDEGERKIINEIFFARDGDGKTEREAAKTIGMPQRTLNDHKLRIFEKLKKLLENEK
jgi:RNA polymerase sigma factor (sigma-70 family)